MTQTVKNIFAAISLLAAAIGTMMVVTVGYSTARLLAAGFTSEATIPIVFTLFLAAATVALVKLALWLMPNTHLSVPSFHALKYAMLMLILAAQTAIVGYFVAQLIRL